MRAAMPHRFCRNGPNAPSDLERFVWDGRTLHRGRLPKGKYVMRIKTVHAVKTQMVFWD